MQSCPNSPLSAVTHTHTRTRTLSLSLSPQHELEKFIVHSESHTMGTAVESVKVLVVRGLAARNITLKPFLLSLLVSLLLLGEDEAGAKKLSGFFG